MKRVKLDLIVNGHSQLSALGKISDSEIKNKSSDEVREIDWIYGHKYNEQRDGTFGIKDVKGRSKISKMYNNLVKIASKHFVGKDYTINTIIDGGPLKLK